jgi:hypothetical protein
MSSYVTIYDANKIWLQIQLDRMRELTSKDFDHYGQIGTWTTLKSSAAGGSLGGSIYPDYLSWILLFNTIWLCSTLPWTGGGAMDMTSQNVDLHREDGIVQNFEVFMIRYRKDKFRLVWKMSHRPRAQCDL